MSFIRNFNKQLAKKSEMMLTTKKEVRVIRTIIAKPKESTGFYKIKKYFSVANMDTQGQDGWFMNFEKDFGSRLL